MKSIWLSVVVITVIVILRAAEARPNEPATESMIGKEPGQVRDDNGLKMKLVWCPPGKFTMGSPKSEEGRGNGEDQVDVTLSSGFWLGKFEVTQSEWKQVMTSEPWKGRKSTNEGEDYPTTWVNWSDAVEFCRKLTAQERQAGRLRNDWEYVLPTEAQWEYACRARTETRFSFGDDAAQLGDYAWFVQNASDAGENFAHRVGLKKANSWGLHDVHGNVWEWCRDAGSEKLLGGRDPGATSDESAKVSSRVFRGGSWFFDAAHCRSGFRGTPDPRYKYNNTGLRVTLSSVQPVR